MGPQKKNKEEKKESLLLGLVDLYLQTGKAISSNSLKDNGFASISSATIRNYFAFLEEEGYLVQKHASGGRVPTDLAYKVYAKHYLEGSEPTEKEIKKIRKNLEEDAKDVARYLEHSAEVLSELSGSAIFLSSPRFDQDLIVDVKLVGIDQKRCLAVVVTNFGLIHSEILHLQKKLSHFAFKRIENFFRFRMTGLNRPLLSPEEEKIGQDFYNEILLRYIVDYSNFSAEDLYKTGFSKLLHYPEFHDTTALANGLALFENASYMRSLLAECVKANELSVWIGRDLKPPFASTFESSILAIPYAIQGKPVGAIALLSPLRAPYPHLFRLLRAFAFVLSEILTENLERHQITYRQPKTEEIDLQTRNPLYIREAHQFQLEMIK